MDKNIVSPGPGGSSRAVGRFPTRQVSRLLIGALAAGTGLALVAGTAVAAPTSRPRPTPTPTRTAAPTPTPTPRLSPTPTITPPAPGALGNVARRDGRIDQFQVVATPGEPQQTALHVWHRRQQVAGGPYGSWAQVSPLSVNPRTAWVTGAEDAHGLIQAFVDVFAGGTDRIYQTTVDGAWILEAFDPGSPPWWGTPSLLTLHDRRIGFAHVTAGVTGHEVGLWYVPQTGTGSWGTWTYLGSGPFTTGVTNPYNLVEAADGTISMTAAMWGAPTTCVARVHQLAAGGAWLWEVDPASAAWCPRR